MVRLLLLAAIAVLGDVQSLTGAPAQVYPTRTVRFIVPFGAASGTDIAARLFADRLAARWGKPVLVENRPGGDGLVAIAAFAAANDDHTLLFAPVGTFTVHPYEHEKLPYDVARDLLPIASVSTIILAVSTSAALKVDSLGELVDLARAQPGKLNAAAANGNAKTGKGPQNLRWQIWHTVRGGADRPDREGRIPEKERGCGARIPRRS